MNKVSLVLGSGGARGYAHIGAIDALEKAGYEIVSISGCSIGALVGGIYAAGNLEPFREWALTLEPLTLLRMIDLSLLSTGGAIKGERVFEKMEPFFGDRLIEELPIRYTAVATDLDKKKEVWFQEGDLQSAIRASIAIPTIFTPLHRNGRILVDGAVLNPLPIAPTMSDRTDLIVAVNLSASYSSPLQPQKPLVAQKSAFKETIEQWLSKIGISSSEKESITQLDVLQRVIEIMQEAMTLYKIAGYTPDILVDVPIDSCRTYDFHKAEELIALGFELTTNAINEYQSRRS
ncbi:serine protease [Campylobacterota bacterium]|nr:serine protease [Campylobacterota bacterium]